MTSDEFFEINKSKYDIILIDGLHLDYQVEKDIINSLDILNDGGAIILHDCSPVDIYHAREDFSDASTPAHLGWNGTVWKAIVKARTELDIYTSTVDIDYGIGIIQKSNTPNKLINDNPYYSYLKFDTDRKKYLNLISKEEFVEQYINKNINSLEKKNITWLAKFDDYSSMGILTQKILGNLNNTNLSCKEIIGQTQTKNQKILDLINKPISKDIGIMFSYPDMVDSLSEFKTRVIYTGVDSTGGIPNFANNSNKADFLLTPSKLSKQRMQNLGVTKPIFVFPHGIDPEIFQYKERPKSDKFKFLYVGECTDRKGIFHLLVAFKELFGMNPNVELHLTSNLMMLFYNGDDVKTIVDTTPNIFWETSDRGYEKTLKLYNECHVYVYPTRADTFGMTLLEAMACGLPIISTSEAGSTELIKGRYLEVPAKLVAVKNHPWMSGEWGEPDIEVLKEHTEILNNGSLLDNSNFIRNNYSWAKVTQDFENNTLPQFKKNYRILTLLTSYNRPRHIENIIKNIKDIREDGVINHVYIVENSDTNVKSEVVDLIKRDIDSGFTLYVSDFNMGQRGALLQMLEDVNIDDYDYVQFTDQDNVFNEKLSTYCEILNENADVFFTTGYMSKEHAELGWRNTKHGKLCEKRSLRAGHMFMRKNDLKSLYPLHLDAHYGEAYNSSWNAGLDWELSWWNAKSPGKTRSNNFVLCVPGGVLHKGIDSTMYAWDVEANEYRLEELLDLRNK